MFQNFLDVASFDDRGWCQIYYKKAYQSLRKPLTKAKLDISVATQLAELRKKTGQLQMELLTIHTVSAYCVSSRTMTVYHRSTDLGGVIMEFLRKGKLTKGEPDASSFPSGGLWPLLRQEDISSMGSYLLYVYQRETLCIPTAFCLHGVRGTDKTPVGLFYGKLEISRRLYSSICLEMMM